MLCPVTYDNCQIGTRRKVTAASSSLPCVLSFVNTLPISKYNLNMSTDVTIAFNFGKLCSQIYVRYDTSILWGYSTSLPSQLVQSEICIHGDGASESCNHTFHFKKIQARLKQMYVQMSEIWDGVSEGVAVTSNVTSTLKICIIILRKKNTRNKLVAMT